MWQQSGLLFMLNCLSGANYLSGSLVCLIKEALSGDPGAKLWDNSKRCDFTGYADISLSFDVTPFIDGDGLGSATSPTLTWVRTSSSGSPQNVVAIAIIVDTGGGSHELLWYDDDFATVIMALDGDTFERVIKFGDDNLVVTP